MNTHEWNCFLSGFCDPRSPRYNQWAMKADDNGKECPIVPGNTNEMSNKNLKPWGPEVRALRGLNAEFQKIEICDLDSVHKSYRLKRAGANPEYVDGFPKNLDYFKTIKQI